MRRGQGVEASREHGLDGLGKGESRGGLQAAAVAGAPEESPLEQESDVLLGVQRVAADETEDAFPDLRRRPPLHELRR